LQQIQRHFLQILDFLAVNVPQKFLHRFEIKIIDQNFVGGRFLHFNREHGFENR
jgi:hypothetical protein